MTETLRTIAEESAFRQTGRIDEVERLSAAFAQRWPDAVRSFEYGRSAQGRPMRALIASRSGALTATEIRNRKIPLLMIQAGIHPGESDGKDAGFIALREMLEGRIAGGILERIAILFVPSFNTDGHENVGRWNRPNQNGPEETGWRATAHNLNLNRDYTKADAPEMQAMLRLIAEWEPLVNADMHVTDGADFEPDISIQVEPINQGDETLRPEGLRLRGELIAHLESRGALPLPFYPDFARIDDPTSGFVLTVYSPRFSTGYYPQRNRFTVLVETHSWKPYDHRVKVSVDTIIGLAQSVDRHGANWLTLANAADAAATHLGGKRLTLDYASSWRETSKAGQPLAERETSGGTLIDFKGYAYTRTPSEFSGELVTKYDPRTPQVWRVPLRDTVSPSVTVLAPEGGYVVPAAYARLLAGKLQLHGIKFEPLSGSKTFDAQAFRASSVAFSAAPFEGRMRATVTGEWRSEPCNADAGWLFVPIAQPLARLIVAILEPQGPDSLVAWGYFNASFEQKEQLEPYVAEMIGRDVLAANPALRAEFEQRLKSDAAFAADPSARLEFFWRHHASWDHAYNRYPVIRVASRPT